MSYNSQQHYTLLPVSLPHVLYTRTPDPSLPAAPFRSTSDHGGRLELDHASSPNPFTSTPDVYLQLAYYPRSPHDTPITQTITTATEIYQESVTSFLLRIPNEFHAVDVPSHEQDPGVFDCFRLQFYDGLEGKMDTMLTGEWEKEYREEHYFGSIGTWGDLVERLSRVFNQYTTFRDPVLGGYLGEGHGYEGQGSSSSPGLGSGYWPDEKKGAAGGAIPKYNPGAYAGEKSQGRLIFVDEDTGSPVLGMEGAKVEAHGIQHGIKDPVEITMPTTPNGPVIVQPAPETYLTDALNPAYSSSSLVNASILASRFIVTTSEYISNAMLTQADRFTKTTKPNAQPITFSPTAHTRIQQFHDFSTTAARFSANAVGKVTEIAQNVGAKLGGKEAHGSRAVGEGKKPGLLNKSMIAFGTVADGVETAAKHLLGTTTTSVTTVVGHKYGDEARQVAHGIGGSVKNVGLVYVDASGVSRRAVVKSVAKGMVVGRVRGGSVTQPQKPGNGEELIIYGGENSSYYGHPGGSSSSMAPPAYQPGAPSPGPSNLGPITNPSQHVQPGVGLDSFGAAQRQPSFPSNTAGANPGFAGTGTRGNGSPKEKKGFF